MNLYRVAMTDHQGQSLLTYAGEAATDVLAVLRSAHGVGMFPTPTGWNVVTANSTDGDLASLSLVHDDGRAVSYLIAPASPSPVIEAARGLASDRGENPEYDRALVEVSATLLGLSSAYADDPEGVRRAVLGGES